MIAIDTNLLVFAHRADAPDHDAVLAVLRPIVEGSAPWALPLGFVQNGWSSLVRLRFQI